MILFIIDAQYRSYSAQLKTGEERDMRARLSRLLGVSLTAIFLAAGVSTTALAMATDGVAVTYELDALDDGPAPYGDGSTVGGTILVDTETGTVSAINLVLTGGSIFPSRTFSTITSQGFDGTNVFFYATDPLDGPVWDPGVDPVFFLTFSLGGSLFAPPLTPSSSTLGFCGTTLCDSLAGSPQASLTEGRLTGTEVPLPPAFLLLGGAIAGLAGYRQTPALFGSALSFGREPHRG